MRHRTTRATADRGCAAVLADTTLYVLALSPERGRDWKLILCSRLTGEQAALIKTRPSEREEPMTQPRAADDFAAIRARMVELRRERQRAEAADSDRERDDPVPRGGSIRWPPQETGEGPGR